MGRSVGKIVGHQGGSGPKPGDGDWPDSWGAYFDDVPGLFGATLKVRENTGHDPQKKWSPVAWIDMVEPGPIDEKPPNEDPQSEPPKPSSYRPPPRHQPTGEEPPF